MAIWRSVVLLACLQLAVGEALLAPTGDCCGKSLRTRFALLTPLRTTLERSGSTSHRYPQFSLGLAVSPDGKWLATRLKQEKKYTTRCALCLVNLTSGGVRVLGRSDSYMGGLFPLVAFSPDSKLLAMCGVAGAAESALIQHPVADYAVQLWDVSTGRELPGLIRAGYTMDASFSPDGKFLAVGGSPNPFLRRRNLLYLWDRRTWNRVKLSTSYHEVLGLSFSPDSTQLAVATDKHVSLVDIREREEVARFDCGAHCYKPVFSADGKYIAAYAAHDTRWHGLGPFVCSDCLSLTGAIRVWDVDPDKNGEMSPGRTLVDGVWLIAFAQAGGTLAAGQQDGTISFWNIGSGRELRRLRLQEGVPWGFVLTPDGTALIGYSQDPYPVVYMWDAITGKELRRWDLTWVTKGQDHP